MSKSTSIVKASDAVVSPVDVNQISKASKALLAHIKKATAASTAVSKNLLADEESTVAETPIWLTLTTKKHIADTNRLQPSKIVLPNPLNADNESTICIIVADPQRHYKNVVASEEFPEELRNRITRVIDVSHLKAKFKTYEAQRQLFNDHDIFLADDRIVNRLPKHLGKTFFKSTAKRPVPVVFMKQREKVDGKRVPQPKGIKPKRDPVENVNARPTPEIVAEIRKAIGSALVSLSPSTNTAIKVGYASWDAEKLAANVEKVINELVERFVPHKWSNVRSFYLKGPETAALPIYQTDELWLDDSKVIADGAEQPEKANIGKKRKAADDETTEDKAEEGFKDESRPTKKAKKAKAAAAALPESNDDKLDKEIATRKATLRKQKAAAKKAVEV